MNQLATQPKGEVIHAPVSSPASLMEVISRAATDPNTDIEKLERLMAMYERITGREAKAAYSSALAEMQPKLPIVGRRGLIKIDPKDGKRGQETPYALWEDINEAISPVLGEHGFALSFRVGKDADRVVVTGVLSHREGHSEETTLSLPMDSTGSKNNVQAIGSSVSYGKRYTASALLNLSSRGEDDDGVAGGARGRSSAFENAVAEINASPDRSALKAWKDKNAGLEEFLPTEEWNEVVRLVNRRAVALKEAGK